MKVGVVAMAGCFDSAFTSVLDVLRTANAARALVDLHLPEIDVKVLAVSREPVRTAGGLLIPIDLAMSLVSRISPQLADVTAKMLLIDDRPSRSLESALGYLSSADQLITDFEAWARVNLHRDISVAEAAAAIGTNRRTLERRTRLRLGMTPYAVIRRLRVEQADHLRHTSDLSLAQIANKVGYRHASSLRAALDAGRS